MNEYWKAFQDITQSVDQLLTDEQSSLEMKQSATSLKETVQPCIEELKQSATRLNRLVLVCSDELYHAENVWSSKPKIAEAAKREIWEQLGKISGCSFRIRNLVIQCKSEAIKKTKNSWEQEIERLRKKWFIDAKGQPKIGIGWSEKEGFTRDIFNEVSPQYSRMRVFISESLSLIYQEIQTINLEKMQNLITLLDPRIKAVLNNQLNSTVSEIETKFSNPTEHLPDNVKGFKDAVRPALQALVNKGWGDIYWEEVIRFKEKVYSAIDSLINSIIDDRVNLATQALARAILFYNDFLERQERYQQETPEQREAEKAWLDQQRQQLEQVQRGIEAILNAS